MTSINFIETLRRLGYPQADEMDPHSLDWAFENEKTRPFLDWLCHSVNEQNLLSQEEVESFEELQASGRVVQGSHLDDILSPTSVLKSLPESESLQSNLEQLSHSLERSKERRNTLMKNNKKLDLKQFSLNSKISKLEKQMEEERNSYKMAVEKCSRQSSMNLEALEKLMSSVKRLVALYDVDSPNQTNEEGSRKTSKFVFLSQVSLKDYHEAEEQFSRDLTAFTKKRFFEVKKIFRME